MLASRNSRLRLRWIVGLVALLIAIRWLAIGGDDADPGGTHAASAHDDAAGAQRDAVLWPALARARTITLAAISIVPGTLRLEGLARDADHNPIGGARITLGRARTATAEADGTFFFDGLSAGSYALTAEHDDQYGEDSDVKLTDDSDPVELELRRGPLVDVLVVESTGEPIAGARVESNDRGATTEADGHARLRAVELRRTMLTITAAGHAPATEAVPTGDDPAATFTRTVVLARGSPVFGLVVDETGQPVDRAFVDLDDGKRDRHEGLWTDAHGVWTLPDLATGTYTASATSETHIATATVTFAHDSAHAQTGIVLRIEPGARISGVVVDPAGKPVAEGKVTAGSQSADTDAQGHFVVTGLVPDTYDVYAFTGTDGSPTQKVTITRGCHVELRFVVTPSSIAGVVVDPRGNPIEDVRVSASSSDPNGRGFGTTDEHGRFDLGGLPPGDYELVATREAEKDRRDTTPIHVTSGNRKLRIVLPELSSIRGRVVLDGRPVPYFGYVLTDTPADLRMETPTPVRDPDGMFRETGLRAGTRAVVIVGPGFVRHVIDNVRVGDGEAVDLGDIAVDRGGSVHGHVTDARGAPIAGASVSIHESHRGSDDDVLGGRLTDRFVTRSDVRGEYTIDGLAPSEDARVIEAVSAHGKSLPRELGPTETEVDLVMSAVGIIDGTLDPTAVTRSFVVATPLGDGGQRFYANPDETGAFVFEPLPVGTYVVRITGPWVMPSRSVEVVADQHVTVAFPPITRLVDVHVHWPDCGYITLQTDTGEHLGGEVCDNDVVTIPSVVPGVYQLCNDTCKTIDVPDAPEVSIEGP